MSNGLLVFIEHKSGTANRSSIEAIAAAQALGSQLGQKVSAVVLGAEETAVEESGFDTFNNDVRLRALHSAPVSLSASRSIASIDLYIAQEHGFFRQERLAADVMGT